MKTNFAIAALISAAAVLTPAHATTVLFTATTTLPAAGNYGSSTTGLALTLSDNAGSIEAYGYKNLFPKTPTLPATATPPVFSGASETGLVVQNDLSGTRGLGVNDATNQDKGFIAPTDAVVLDFSGVNNPATYNSQTGYISSVTFKLYEDYSGADYEIYGVTGSYGKAGATYTVIQSGQMSNSTPLTVSTSSLYSSYVIGVTDCALDIQSISLNYSPAPEPGTFVMAGIALIGLGVTLKKRSRKA